uniref:Glutamyl-tRNA(Gln) amidotransferase subunit A n=1 Tax=candidate division WOR-3 bacterium TaxID=2052148 RepID=A0A7C3J5Q2_UNCW3
MNIEDLRESFITGKVSPVEIVDNLYKKIDEDDLNDFITLSKNIAYETAYLSEKRYKKGDTVSDIDGIPFSLKDNFAVKGLRMTCGSKILSDFISPYDSTVYQRLKKCGAVLIGKNNLDEFAMGSSNETSFFGVVKNPCDREYVPGGSSGGSAVSVASKHSTFSIGSDTGGSVRQPASFCGVVGFKPTYGKISRYGLVAFSSSLDTVGIITLNVSDCKKVFKIVRGNDEHDSTIDDYKNEKRDLKKICFVKDIPHADLKVTKKYEEICSKLERMGFSLQPVNLDFIDLSMAAYKIQTMCEASSNLARYDGIKYGLQKVSGNDLFDIYSKVRGEGFGKEVKRRIMTGTYLLMYENGKYYSLSFKLRDYISNSVDRIFENFDMMVLPTSLSLPFKIGERVDDPVMMHLSDSLTAFANLANVPAININAGYYGKLPIGVQFIGKRNDDDNLLDWVKIIEEEIKKDE